MKPIFWLFVVVLVGLVSSNSTRSYVSESAFQDGFDDGSAQGKLEADWLRAAHNHYYWKLAAKEATPEEKNQWLRETFEHQMWNSIPGLYECWKSPYTERQDRQAAGRILGRMILHFKENPRHPEMVPQVNIKDEFNELISKSGEQTDQEKQITEKLQEPLEEMDDFVEALYDAQAAQDFRVRRILRKAEAEQDAAPQIRPR